VDTPRAPRCLAQYQRAEILVIIVHRFDFAEEPGGATYLVVGCSLLLHGPLLLPAVLSFRFGAQSQRVDYPESTSHDLVLTLLFLCHVMTADWHGGGGGARENPFKHWGNIFKR
jgi:hypothetical protein